MERARIMDMDAFYSTFFFVVLFLVPQIVGVCWPLPFIKSSSCGH